ncbi:hypothetical protein Q8791_19940 [Nocardiopsis sp. CT-R113]|uniref:Uncharacterized protein n=1 Tax=Nocardiopsis codii TaxID=3065942 RepID=A0ABU7KB92_9ACTN|nr:hypothetical protein [Nocardiopsis sp. CT-R113]MEE2039496.1 hypothetical protein [Nocardiopsis sp. CT-R113]
MADTSRGTRVLNTLLPHSLTPLQRDIANRFDEIDAHRETAKRRCAEVCAAAVRYQSHTGAKDGAVTEAARGLSVRVIAEVEKAHTFFALELSRNRNRITALELGWRTGRRGAAADHHAALRTDRAEGERALTDFLTLLDQKEGLVRPVAGRSTGDPLVSRAADVPGTRAPATPAPRPRTALHDRPGRTSPGTVGRATVQPAARRDPRAPGRPRRGSAPSA